jgi:hypothetical protein
MNSSQQALANSALNSVPLFQSLHNKNLKLDGATHRPLSKSYANKDY